MARFSRVNKKKQMFLFSIEIGNVKGRHFPSRCNLETKMPRSNVKSSIVLEFKIAVFGDVGSIARV